MENAERRITRRYVIQIPTNFRVCGHPNPKAPKQFGEVIDISPLGISFTTSVTLTIGDNIEVFLKVPSDVIGRPSPEWAWIGKVVHSRISGSQRGGTVVGLQFLSCQSTEDSERQQDRSAAKAEVNSEPRRDQAIATALLKDVKPHNALPTHHTASGTTEKNGRRYPLYDMSGRKIS